MNDNTFSKAHGGAEGKRFFLNYLGGEWNSFTISRKDENGNNVSTIRSDYEGFCELRKLANELGSFLQQNGFPSEDSHPLESQSER